jgi:hypothetical protein
MGYEDVVRGGETVDPFRHLLYRLGDGHSAVLGEKIGGDVEQVFVGWYGVLVQARIDVSVEHLACTEVLNGDVPEVELAGVNRFHVKDEMYGGMR